MKTLLPLCFLVSFLCGGVLPCPGGMGGGWGSPDVVIDSCIQMIGPGPFCEGLGMGGFYGKSVRFYSSDVAPAVNPYADGTGVLYGNGFQSSPLGPAPAPVDYGQYPGQNFMRAQGGCIHSCGWGKKK